MLIDGYNINEDEILKKDVHFLKKYGNIYISDEQVSILEKYNINILDYKNVSELIYALEDYLNNSYEQLDDLEWVEETLSEYNYYNNTNK